MATPCKNMISLQLEYSSKTIMRDPFMSEHLSFDNFFLHGWFEIHIDEPVISHQLLPINYDHCSLLLIFYATCATYGTSGINTYLNMEFLQTSLQYYIYLPNNYLYLLKQMSDHFHVYICVYATSTVSGTSGTDLTMSINNPEILKMLRKSGSRVIHRCKFQICNQI